MRNCTISGFLAVTQPISTIGVAYHYPIYIRAHHPVEAIIIVQLHAAGVKAHLRWAASCRSQRFAHLAQLVAVAVVEICAGGYRAANRLDVLRQAVVGVVAVGYGVVVGTAYRHRAAVAEAVVLIRCAKACTFAFAGQAADAVVGVGAYAAGVVGFGALVAVGEVGVVVGGYHRVAAAVFQAG